MRHRIQILALSILALNAFAKDSVLTEPAKPAHKKVSCKYSQRFQIGGNYTYAWVTPSGNSTTSGSLGGTQAIYEYRPLEFFYGAAAFSWRIGTTENDVTKRELQDFNIQERLGYTFFKRSAKSRLTLFSGFGARYLAEKVTVGTASVDYDYTEFYIPIGFLFENRVNSLFSWGVNFQWMPQVLPMVRMQPLGGAQWDISYQLGNAFVEAPLRFSAYSNRFSLIISPFVESWHDGHTMATTNFGFSLNLPKNTYLFTGVNVNLGVLF